MRSASSLDRRELTFAAMVLPVMLLGLPLLGVALTGAPLAPFLEFPPLTRYVRHAPFSWPHFIGMALLIAATVAPFVWHVARSRAIAEPRPSAPAARRLSAGLLLAGTLLVAVFWTLSWTRFPGLRSCQHLVFTPLWLGYILAINGLTLRRGGRCLLRAHPWRFLALFPVSAGFWWFFEYLNRFVQNWYYVGIADLTHLDYVVFATLSFSTVLPAVMSTEELLATVPRLTAGLDRGWRLALPHPRRWAALWLVAAAAGLAGIGVRPDLLFPLLWVSPLVILCALQALRGRVTLFTPLAAGDWRRLVRLALAALVCGFFWELWNFHSAAKWIYAVPYVQRFHLFEMPILGFAGYLPFGLECAVISDAVSRAFATPQQRNPTHADDPIS